MVEEAVLMPSVTVVNWLLPLPTMDYELESHRVLGDVDVPTPKQANT